MKKKEETLEDFVQKALQRANDCYEHWHPIYERAREDLYFQSDEPYAQWDVKAAMAREKSGRPVLTIDQLAQFVNQVSNDIRMNTPSIDIVPVGGGADIETAEIYQGLIKAIEYESNADDAYDNASQFSIKCGIGFMRVDHKYPDAMSFEQDLFIERMINPFAVLLDCNSIEPDGSDAKYCYVLDKLSREEYREKYPDATSEASFCVNEHYTTENEKDEITIAEYFYVEEIPVTLVLEGGFPRILQEGEQPIPGQISRQTTKRVIHRCILNGEEELSRTIFPGEYIPIVPVYGEEAWREGQRHLVSLIRRSKDAQRMYNYWASMETELLMRSPKAPILAAEGTTEDYAEDYLNPDKAAVLRYKQKDSQNMPAPPPQILPPIQIPSGIVNARQQATQDIRATMGLYDAFLGQQDNAISGVAINNRQREGNRAVFHYADNLVRSITQLGRVLVSAIPQVYDTPRVVRIIGKEETNDIVGINGMYVEGQERNYSLAEGRFAVRVTSGASFSTMRQEAAEWFMKVIAAYPSLIDVIGDIAFKYSDFPGAQAASERIKRIIRPEILEDNQDPQVAAMQAQNQQLQQGIAVLEGQIAQMQQMLQEKQSEIQIKAQSEEYDAINEARRHQLDAEKLRLDAEVKQAELALKQQELELRAFELGLKTNKQANDQVKEALPEVAQLSAGVTEGVNYV